MPPDGIEVRQKNHRAFSDIVRDHVCGNRVVADVVGIHQV